MSVSYNTLKHLTIRVDTHIAQFYWVACAVRPPPAYSSPSFSCEVVQPGTGFGSRYCSMNPPSLATKSVEPIGKFRSRYLQGHHAADHLLECDSCLAS